MDSACVRAVKEKYDGRYGEDGDVVSLADAFPLLLISQGALDLLNSKVAQPLPMLRFRPNLVVAGTEPHAEDGWKRIRIGTLEFDVVKPCTRCVFTTVDFEHGRFDPSGEPLRTLKTYRRSPDGITFGQNLIPRSTGRLRVGDALQASSQLQSHQRIEAEVEKAPVDLDARCIGVSQDRGGLCKHRGQELAESFAIG